MLAKTSFLPLVKEAIELHNNFEGFDLEEQDDMAEDVHKNKDINIISYDNEVEGAVAVIENAAGLSEQEISDKLSEQQKEIEELEARIRDKETTISSFNKTQEGYCKYYLSTHFVIICIYIYSEQTPGTSAATRSTIANRRQHRVKTCCQSHWG